MRRVQLTLAPLRRVLLTLVLLTPVLLTPAHVAPALVGARLGGRERAWTAKTAAPDRGVPGSAGRGYADRTCGAARPGVGQRER